MIRRNASLRFLTLGVLLLLFTTLAVAQWASTHLLYGEGFDQQERSDALARAKQARGLVLERAEFLNNYAGDNGDWDDAVNFVNGTDPTLPEREFVPQTHRRMFLDAYGFLDAAKRPLHIAQFDENAGKFVPASPRMRTLFDADSSIGRRLVATKSVSGFARIGADIYAWGAAPITHSGQSGPVAGYIIFISQLGDGFRAAASKRVDASLSLAAVLSETAGDHDRILQTHGDMLEMDLVVGRLDEHEVLQIKVTRARLIHAIAVRASHYLLASTLLFGALVTMIALLFVERRLLKPLVAASKTLARIGKTADLSTRLAPPAHADEIGRLVAATNDMLSELQIKRDAEAARDAALRASQLKSEFLARMSHEIRTPMNAVMGMTELLQSTNLTPRQRRLAVTAHRSADSLLGIINDILDFSKIESGHFELDIADFDLREMLEDTVEMVAERAHAKGLELVLAVEPGVPGIVTGDAARLRQVLTNLVGNAIKFTDIGEVTVRVGSRGAVGIRHPLEFMVTDTGIGISPEAQQHIFDAFTQADGSTTRRFEGTGLGLAISRQLVTLMGGTLNVRSKAGAGATFTVAIELEARPSATAGARKPADLAGVRVLVVDDNATNREVLECQLSAAGAAVTCAKSGEGALGRLEETGAAPAFDVLITDRRMPGMSGDVLVQRIRRRPTLSELRIIMLSSMDISDDAAVQATSGINAHLTKPVRGAQLVSTVAAVAHQGHRDAPPRSAKTAPAGVPDALLLRVLLVEDNVVNREVALGMLDRLGCTVLEAGNGADAMEIYHPDAIDVILMDCQMPVMDGYEATREIRSRERAAMHVAVPIIALTANALPGDRARCLEAGMTEFLAKPFTLGALRQMLEPYAATAAGRQDEPSFNPDETFVEAYTGTEILFDEAALTELEGLGDAALVDTLIAYFQRDSATLLAELTHDESPGFDGAARAVHTLKSMSERLGGVRLAAACRQYETHLRNGDRAAAAALIPNILATHQALCDVFSLRRRASVA